MRYTRTALVIAVAGLAVSLIWALTALRDQVQRPDQFARADVPGRVQVELTQPGPHVVYYEVADGADVAQLPTAAIEVLDSAGVVVPVDPYRADLRYDHDGFQGRAVGQFTAPRTGVYLVTTSARTSAGVIAVGDDLAPGVVRAIALPSLIAVGALVVATLLLLVPAGARQPEHTR